jgi:hypothetical protein
MGRGAHLENAEVEENEDDVDDCCKGRLHFANHRACVLHARLDISFRLQTVFR